MNGNVCLRCPFASKAPCIRFVITFGNMKFDATDAHFHQSSRRDLPAHGRHTRFQAKALHINPNNMNHVRFNPLFIAKRTSINPAKVTKGSKNRCAPVQFPSRGIVAVQICSNTVCSLSHAVKVAFTWKLSRVHVNTVTALVLTAQSFLAISIS